jgi:hypothetical protein
LILRRNKWPAAALATGSATAEPQIRLQANRPRAAKACSKLTSSSDRQRIAGAAEKIARSFAYMKHVK